MIKKPGNNRTFSLSASIPFSASDGEKVAAGRMRCSGQDREIQGHPDLQTRPRLGHQTQKQG